MRSHCLLAIAAVLAVPAHARADRASTLKQQGLKAAQDKNWDVARERFEQSYALDPRPLTLFNLAVAQEHTDRLLAARESYATFLEQPATPDAEPFRKLARSAIPALDDAIPTLQVRATGLAAGDALELDGRALTTSEPTPLDPGSHTIVVRRAGEPIAQRAITLVRGRRDDVELAVPAPPPPPVVPLRVAPPPVPPPRLTFERSPAREQPGGLLRSPWFWGVATAVVLGAAGAGYYYLAAPDHDPTRGTLRPGVLPVP